jgi:hypothetical protein
LTTHEGRFKALVLTLALQIVAASSMLHAQFLPIPSTESLAGFHQHGHKTPSPQPQSFVCCLSGHGFAIVRALSLSAPAYSDRLQFSDFANETSVVLFPVGNSRQFISSSDPPAVSPLRI